MSMSPRARPILRIGARTSSRSLAIVTVAVFVGFVAVWAWKSVNTTAGAFPPSPAETASRLWTDLRDGRLWADFKATGSRVVIAFAISTAMALPLGILAGTSRRWQAAVLPFSEFVRYMPVTAFVAVSIVWVGVDESQKWFLIWMGTFFQQVLMVADDTKRVPGELLDVGRTLGLRDSEILRTIVLRSAAPRIWDSNRLALGWAWTWVVLAEQVNPKHGLGYAINLGQKFNQLDRIAAYLVALGILGLVTDQVLRAVGRRLFQHEQVRT
jgi:NitT/TauT family transport system permease protein